MVYYSKDKLIKGSWRLCINSQEGQSFLEIMNLIKQCGTGGLEWEKGTGFKQKK